ncbi:hypothetical protein HJD18_15415 [Thermoleophilia bacterium SCSIO 60948]|nr:hypothetical protein HJD18_15415 [Thermoleophilia bacterium SCSIO 60948]
MIRTCAALATLIVLALTLAACGASSEPTSGTPRPEPEAPLPKDEFIAQADQICLSGDSRIEAAADDLATRNRQPTPAELRKLVEGLIVPGLRAEVDAIGALPPPEGSEDDVEAILDATSRAVDEIEADPTAVLDGPPPALREAGRLAREFGSEECGVQ